MTNTATNQLKIEVFALEEHVAVKGSFALGDDKLDQRMEKKILKDLETNPWAWCTVQIKASIGEFEGSAYLGCCNYKSEADFKKTSGYYSDMKEEAIAELRKVLESAKVALDVLETGAVPE